MQILSKLCKIPQKQRKLQEKGLQMLVIKAVLKYN